MGDKVSVPAWVVRGKTIGELVKELQTFEDDGLPVLISTDNGDTRKVISIVMKSQGACLLLNAE